MKLIFLGTCAGTEPMPDRKHSSFALETAGRLYWFDAGEGCSYTAHNMGLDLLAVQKVVISHTHRDHVGGLGNLLWNIRKLTYVKKRPADAEIIDVYIPSMEVWDGLMMVLRNTEFGDDFPKHLKAQETWDGLLFDDGYLRVTAHHNHHIPAKNGKWQSYSFLIECEGKRIVYSGDVKAYSDFDSLLGDGCDALILETGHFVIDDAWEYAQSKNIGKLFFTHNGREILYNPEACQEKVHTLWKGAAAICYDGMTAEL